MSGVNEKTKVSTKITSNLVKKDENGEVFEMIEREYEQKPNGKKVLLGQQVYRDDEAKTKAEELKKSLDEREKNGGKVIDLN